MFADALVDSLINLFENDLLEILEIGKWIIQKEN